MANQYIEQKSNGASAIADDSTGRAIIRNIAGKAAGFVYDKVAHLIKYNGNDAVKTLVSEDGTQTLTGKTLTSPTITTPTLTVNVEAVTALGTNQTTAAPVTAVSVAVLSVTGATDTGLLLPAATPGKVFMMKKLTTDTINIYATGAETVNGTTDALAIGAIGAVAFCVVSGAWRVLNVAS